MPKNREVKEQLLNEYKDKLSRAISGVIVCNRGLTVEQDTLFRKKLREAGIEYKVVKKTLFTFAAREANLSDLEQFFEGPIAIAMSYDDPVKTAKLVVESAKGLEKLEIRGGFIEGKVISAADVEAIAKLPSREELVAKMLGGLNAPISGLVGVLSGTIRKLVYALDAISKKQSA
ncbi:50S ribosomal protein L10 [Caldicellulosiruptoraceae bacterium PP1]